MTSEEFINSLNKYEANMRWALYDNTLKCLQQSESEELAKIYHQYTGDNSNYYITNVNCPTCRLDLFKKLGSIYFNVVTTINSSETLGLTTPKVVKVESSKYTKTIKAVKKKAKKVIKKITK